MTIPKGGPASGRSCKRCNNWAGPTAATFKSFVATPTVTQTARAYAAELVAFAPDVVLTSGASTVGLMRQATRIMPVVFAGVADPVSLARSRARPRPSALN